MNSNLDMNSANDIPCLATAASNTGIMFASAHLSTGQSWCFQQQWINNGDQQFRHGANKKFIRGVTARSGWNDLCWQKVTLPIALSGTAP
jgi:hypothetical protein